MKRWKFLAIAALAGICFTMAAPKVEAQININIGPAPECPYGYYDYAPYGCAPYGYYGPEWFTGGVFVGAGVSHAVGAVPDPGSTAHTPVYLLGEDAAWHAPVTVGWASR